MLPTIVIEPTNHSLVVISSGLAKPGATSSTCAPSAANASAALRTAAATSGSTFLHVTEIGRERDAQPAHAVGEPDAIVARIVRQRRPVARVGPAHHREHQREVVDAARVRADVRNGAHRRKRIRGHPAERRLDARGCRRTSTGCGWSPRRRCRPRAAPCRKPRLRRRRRTIRRASSSYSTDCA